MRRHQRTTAPDLPEPTRFPVEWEPQFTLVWYDTSGKRNVYTAGIKVGGSPATLHDLERCIQDLADLVRPVGVAVSLDSPTIRRTVD